MARRNRETVQLEAMVQRVSVNARKRHAARQAAQQRIGLATTIPLAHRPGRKLDVAFLAPTS